MTTSSTSKPNWHALFNFTVNSAYIYSFMEWIFFVTKPSSLSLLSLYKKLEVLVITGGIIALILLAMLFIFSLPARMSNNSKWRVRLLNIRYIPSVLMLSITVLIMLDNFTYTLYEFGIVSTEGVLRIVYAVGFLAIFWQTFRFAKQSVHTGQNSVSYLTYGLLAASMAGILTNFSTGLTTGNLLNSPKPSIDRPNIIILGSDGLSAKFMSVYGYTEETTPFLNQMAKTSLVAENAFSNASSTTASTTSALTGKEPITVDVLRYPDILTGSDSFEHLPGILKQYGYKTVEMGIPYYIDATKLNLLDGFDIVNNQSTTPLVLNVIRKFLGNSPSTYFIQTIIQRVNDRLLHIFVLKEMQNPLREVVSPSFRIPDTQRVDEIINLIDQTDQPVFIFAHMMNTHGPLFASDKQVFSNSSNSDEEWDEGYYKDAVLSFDNNVQKIYNHLSQTGQLNNTILVIYTDHGYGYAVNHRIPIIIHFPENAHTGTRINNVEVLDIPVTLLDYLDISTPEWMTGISMLSDEPPSDREIISIVAGSPTKIAPPFYQIKKVQIIICHKWYALNVQENSWKSGLITSHTSRCDSESLSTDDQIRERILNYLIEYNFDVSSLQ